jgi:hypothetical protein
MTMILTGLAIGMAPLSVEAATMSHCRQGEQHDRGQERREANLSLFHATTYH